MLLPALIIAVLLLVNAFFVVAEFAIVGVQRSAIDARASRHDRLARLVLGVLDEPRRKDLYIATAQIGITLEIESPATADQIKAYLPAIRNAILLIIALFFLLFIVLSVVNRKSSSSLNDNDRAVRVRRALQ